MIAALRRTRCAPTSVRLRLLRAQRAFTTFQEGDHVIFKPADDPSHAGYLSKPLYVRGSSHTTHGQLKYEDVIGKSPRDIVQTKKGIAYRLQEASLADYVVLSKRIVTPIYPPHANIIVSLLELHPAQASASRKLEILEAGTGHGGLTLYLARAIHGANGPCPALPSSCAPTSSAQTKTSSSEKEQELDDTAITEWKEKRNSIVHTLDISTKHSQHARLVVRNFRRGLYYGNVDFHVDDLSGFFKQRVMSLIASEALLDHIILDMPATDEQISLVTPHLRPDGKLLVFNPSITQIVDCVRVIAEQNLPLELERVIELPAGSAGGREWDVRMVPIRRLAHVPEKESTNIGWFSWLRSLLTGSTSSDKAIKAAMAAVCRPKIVAQMSVGGFVAVWRKKSDSG